MNKIKVRNIVVEGVDASGKSTLCRHLHEVTGWPIALREGKPPTFEKTLEKIQRFQGYEGKIIDRHPLVSQAIYGQTVRQDPNLPMELVTAIHEQGNLWIYCRCIDWNNPLGNHVVKLGEDAEHLDALKLQFPEILDLYDEWALHSAHIIYNNHGNMEFIGNCVKGALGLEC